LEAKRERAFPAKSALVMNVKAVSSLRCALLEDLPR
jgi:hypothetical protein